jgi:hypothetical protein
MEARRRLRLREFCVGQLCSVVPRRALGSICNGHPASEVVKNQTVTIEKTPVSRVWQASNFEPGGRRFESVRAH